MKTLLKLITLTTLVFATAIPAAYAGTVSVTGNIFYTTLNGETGTTYDRWNINMLNTGRFSVNVLAFESTSNSPDDAVDINGDGEFTYLDPDTYFYKKTANPLLAEDFLARCDDINNNCDAIDTPTIKLNSLSEAQGAADGSIHSRRDPAFNIELAAGKYLYLMADYRLSPSDAADGFDYGNSIRNTSLEGHADYMITFSSNTMAFDVSGNTITISIPVPASSWLLFTGLISFVGIRKFHI